MIFIALIAIFAMSAMPYVTGWIAETAIHNWSEQLNLGNNEYGRFTIVSYERGFRASKSRFSWSPKQTNGLQMDKELTIDCDGVHGVLSYSYDCHLLGVTGYSDFINTRLGGVDPIKVHGSINLLGENSQTLTLDAFDLENKNGDIVNVYPGVFEIASDRDLSVFSVEGHFDGLNVNASDGKVTLGKTAIIGEVWKNDHQLALGGISINVNEVVIESQTQGNINIKQMVMQSSSHENGENLTIGYELSANNFSQISESSALSLSNLHLALSLDGLDMVQIRALNKNMQALSTKAQSEKNASLLGLLPVFESILKPGLSLAVELSADHKGEGVVAKVMLALTKKLSLGDFLLFSVNPKNIFTKINLEVDNQLPSSFLDEQTVLKQRVIAGPWHARSGNGYASNFQINGGLIKLNGKNLEVDELLALLGLRVSNRRWGRGL